MKKRYESCNARLQASNLCELSVNYGGIEIPSERIADFCRRNRIRRLALFGSILRDDFGPASDVDVLVEFAPDAGVGLRFFALERELAQILGRKADLNTPGFLDRYYREEVLRKAEVLYDDA